MNQEIPPFAPPTHPAPPPLNGNDTTWAWVAYAFEAVGLFMVWPWLIGLVINYVQRDETAGTFISSHHRWMIRTFWFSALWYTVALLTIVGGAWPVVSVAIEGSNGPGDIRFALDWQDIFATFTAALIGAFGMLAVWVWTVYRVVRGMVQLANSRALP
ncbi:MAG: hypothetical protein RR758_11325 [Burkholderiaceae bacterium]